MGVHNPMVNGHSFSADAIILMSVIGVNIRAELMRVGEICHKGPGSVTREDIMAAINRMELDPYLAEDER